MNETSGVSPPEPVGCSTIGVGFVALLSWLWAVIPAGEAACSVGAIFKDAGGISVGAGLGVGEGNGGSGGVGVGVGVPVGVGVELGRMISRFVDNVLLGVDVDVTVGVGVEVGERLSRK